MLTLRDLQSSKSHAVSPAGSVIGREGGDADITVRTASVSKKHARVYCEDGTWFLEDLRSANGTFVDNEKIAEPIELKIKTVFDLAGYRFEVLSIVEDQEEPEEEEDASNRTFTGTSPEPEPKPEPKRPVARLGPGGRPPPRAAASDQGKTTAGKPTAKASANASAPKPTVEQSAAEEEQEESEQEEKADKPEGEEPEASTSGESEQPESEEPAEATREQQAVAPAAEEASAASPDDLKDPKAAAGKVLADLPKAIAYYMVAVPKLLFNPKGTILKSVDNQTFPGIDGMPLIAWALPGLAGAVAVQMVCSFLAALIVSIRGTFSIGAILVPLILAVVAPVLVGVVGGLCTAFLYHRVTAFIIKLLKGESDLKSRTNHLIFFQGAVILGIVPTAAGIILGALTFIPVVGPFLLLIPILLQLASSLIILGASYVWLKYFKVHPIIPKVVLVFMALAVVGTVFSSLGTIRGAFSGASATVAVAGGGDTKASEDSGDEDSTDAKPLDPKIKKQLEDAKKAGAKAVADAKKAAEDAKEAGDEAAQEAKDAADKAAKEAKEAAAKATEKPPKKEPAPEKVAAPTPAPEAEGGSATPAEPAGDQTPYQRWAAKRAFVERTLDADPTILAKDPGLAALYRAFHDKHREIRKKIGGKNGIAPDDMFNQRKAEADTFNQTGKLMDELYNKVHK